MLNSTMSGVTFALAFAFFTVSCSSSHDKTGHDGSSHNESSEEDAGAPESGETSGSTLAAPTLDEVSKMMGSLHVMWTNNEAACDSIEGERQAQMLDGSIMQKYKLVFTVAGDAEDEHDTSANDDMKYTYRLRCKKGDAYSKYSNELSGNPKE